MNLFPSSHLRLLVMPVCSQLNVLVQVVVGRIKTSNCIGRTCISQITKIGQDLKYNFSAPVSSQSESQKFVKATKLPESVCCSLLQFIVQYKGKRHEYFCRHSCPGNAQDAKLVNIWQRLTARATTAAGKKARELGRFQLNQKL